MRRYLIDTGPLAAYLLGRPWAIAALDPWLDRHEAATSILVYGEVTEYLQSLPDVASRLRQLRQQLLEIRPYVPTYSIMERYATLRRQLRRGPGIIGDIDTLIAATALERGLTVVTIDTDFQRVPGLSVMLLPRSTP
jgi:predicted nucleic acid-binding protein